jgi:hypothetical protein
VAAAAFGAAASDQRHSLPPRLLVGERQRMVRPLESRFRTRRIFDEWDRFDLIVAALDSNTILSVHHLVTSPPEDEPYTALKEGLLHNHQLTDYQRIEKLFAVETLGSRKPTQLLSQMMELCPEGEQQSKFFVFLFLHRLPGWLRIMLGDDDHQDVHALAVKADKLQALYGHLQHVLYGGLGIGKL